MKKLLFLIAIGTLVGCSKPAVENKKAPEKVTLSDDDGCSNVGTFSDVTDADVREATTEEDLNNLVCKLKVLTKSDKQKYKGLLITAYEKLDSL